MPAHLQKPLVEGAVFTDEDGFNRRLHVIVDAAPASTTIGIRRATVKVTLANLTCNMNRLIFHERRTATE